MLLLTFIVSLSIETIQLSIGRVFDVDDVILNVLGGLIGFILYKVLNKVIPDKLNKSYKKMEWLKIIKNPTFFLQCIFQYIFIIIIILIILVVRFLVP